MTGRLGLVIVLVKLVVVGVPGGGEIAEFVMLMIGRCDRYRDVVYDSDKTK